MALSRDGRKTEHAGAKNGDKRGKRADVKQASRKLRRRALTNDELALWVDKFVAEHPRIMARLAEND